MASLTVITNHVPRDILDSYELSPKEREEFDYLNWDALDKGEGSASFFRYRGQTYDMGEFMRTPTNSELASWDGYMNDTFFSGIAVRFVEDNERVIVARFYS